MALTVSNTLMHFLWKICHERASTDAPDVYHLFQTLGITQRKKRSGQETYSSEVLMSACIVLNALSQRVKGLQLTDEHYAGSKVYQQTGKCNAIPNKSRL